MHTTSDARRGCKLVKRIVREDDIISMAISEVVDQLSSDLEEEIGGVNR